MPAKTGLFTHADCLEHDTGTGHPENAARLEAVLSALQGSSFTDLARYGAPLATIEQIKRAHHPDYVDGIFHSIPEGGVIPLDARPETFVSSGSKKAALRAVGAVCAAVDAVMAGEIRNAFCAVRPPGHHAETGPLRAEAMGYCLFNNIVVGAIHARHRHGIQRIAILDFDVHHGNGTQEMVWKDLDIFFASSHQFPLYPGTGTESETGPYRTIVNVPLAPLTPSNLFHDLWQRKILTRLEHFSPQIIFISAGFDAHQQDPLSQQLLTEGDFARLTRAIRDVAERVCEGRIVSSLEGGYNLAALASSVAAHVSALMK